MYAIQLSKAFSKDGTTEERISGGKEVIKLLVAGEILSSILSTVSGDKDKEYSLVNTLNWELGGLSLGLARDVLTFIGDIAVASVGDEERQKAAKSRLPGEAS